MNGSKASEVSNDSESVLRAHVLAAQNFIGTGAAYCRRNGINPKQFYVMQERLGISARPAQKRPKAFVRVEPVAASPADEGRPLGRTQSLPDAKWVAELVKALMAQR